MSKFTVSEKGQELGVYEGETAQDARDACAVAAGYESESDMESKLESASEFEVDRVLSAEDYAGSENLWIQAIDPDNTTPFDSVSFGKRVELAQSVMDSNE